MLQLLEGYRNCSARAIDSIPLEQVAKLINELATVKALAGRVFCIGNGGSQANVAHLVLHLREHGITAIDLLADNASVTAIANDYGYDLVASIQLRRAMLGANDMVLAISGSGSSDNVAYAMKEDARKWAVVGDMPAMGIDWGKRELVMSGGAVLLDTAEYGPFEDASAAVIHMINEGLSSLAG